MLSIARNGYRLMRRIRVHVFAMRTRRAPMARAGAAALICRSTGDTPAQPPTDEMRPAAPSQRGRARARWRKPRRAERSRRRRAPARIQRPRRTRPRPLRRLGSQRPRLRFLRRRYRAITTVAPTRRGRRGRSRPRCTCGCSHRTRRFRPRRASPRSCRGSRLRRGRA